MGRSHDRISPDRGNGVFDQIGERATSPPAKKVP